MTSSASQRGYDRLAPWYATIERCVFGRRLERARRQLLGELPRFQRALVLGDGDGRILAELIDRDRASQFISLDHSRRMLALQQRRVPKSEHHRIAWLHADARDLPLAANHFDLLVTICLTDCFERPTLQTAIVDWTARTTAAAIWWHVDFIMPRGRLARILAATTSAAMHAFFRWQTDLPNRHLDDPDPLIQAAGWAPLATQSMSHPFIRSRLYRRTEHAR